jgi:hypothetical protein
MKQKFSADDYTYYFSADFVSGKNTIKHSYDFKCTVLGEPDYSVIFPYLLTTGKMWENKEIEDFTLNIYTEGHNYFSVQKYFEKQDTGCYWQMKGKGRMVNNVNSTDVYIKDGYLQFHKNHFKPDLDLQISTSEYILNHGIDKTLDEDMNDWDILSNALKSNHLIFS